jgi:hypothetical protein
MYVKRNIEARSRNHCCRGKATSITYFCVCVWARARGRVFLCVRVCWCGCTGEGVYFRGCSPSYSARNTHAPCCHLRFLWLHHMFYLINGTIFGKQLRGIKCILIFSTAFIWNISHFKKNSARYCYKYQNQYGWSRAVPCRQPDGRTWRSQQSLFAILRTRLTSSRNLSKSFSLQLWCLQIFLGKKLFAVMPTEASPPSNGPFSR